MTAALIAIILCLIVGWYDSASKQEKLKKYRESTKTNIALEQKLWVKWVDIIDKELKENKHNYPPLKQLYLLYEKYNVPYLRWNEDKQDAIKYKEAIIEEYKRLDDVVKRIRGWKHPTGDIYVCPYHGSTTSMRDGEENMSRFEKNKRLAKNWSWDDVVYLKIPEGKISNYNYLMYSKTARSRYCNLIDLLVKKELKSHGFNMSPYGTSSGKESEWQEAEKRAKRSEEENKNYPWLKP